MNRLAAMHDWPLFWTRACTATGTARSRSAEARTTNGSEPPSSSTHFFNASPAAAATDWPARSLPVSVTATTRSSAMTRATSPDPIKQRRERPFRIAGPSEQVLQRQRGLRDVRRVLEQADVADHERRRGEADDLPQREVPRHHRQDRPQRLVAHEAPTGRRLDHLVGQQRLGVLGEPAHRVGALRRLALGRGERLAHLRRQHPGDVGDLAFEQLGRGHAAAAPARRTSSGGTSRTSPRPGPAERRPRRRCGRRTSARPRRSPGSSSRRPCVDSYPPASYPLARDRPALTHAPRCGQPDDVARGATVAQWPGTSPNDNSGTTAARSCADWTAARASS